MSLTPCVSSAINIPVASKSFEAQVKPLRAKTSNPIVFYCNGRTCMKSYLATRKAQAAGLFPGMEPWVSLDHEAKIHDYIDLAKRKNKTLCIYDEVGHQVQWLQDALVQANVKNYYFMKDGARPIMSR